MIEKHHCIACQSTIEGNLHVSVSTICRRASCDHVDSSKCFRSDFYAHPNCLEEAKKIAASKKMIIC